MTKRLLHFALLLLLCCTTAQAQKDWLPVKAARALGAFIDNMATNGIDTNYIVVPKQPGQLIVRNNISQMNLKMNSFFNDIEGYKGFDIGWEPYLRTGSSNLTGVWLGYRGYGLGYSVELGSRKGTLFTIGATGGRYGINLRLRTFGLKSADVRLYGALDGEPFDLEETAELEAPIRVRSLIIDGYYLFNGKYFSYAAAYDQSTIQVHSAGSLMAGLMWHATSVRYNDVENIELVNIMHDIGTMRIRQGGIGVGYAYNWVPVRGLLVNAMFMPMLMLINRQKVDIYNCDYEEIVDEEGDYVGLVVNDFSYKDSESRNGKVTLTYNARMSLTYNWHRFFINAYGQWNHYRFGTLNEGHGRINDWYINACVGFRF